MYKIRVDFIKSRLDCKMFITTFEATESEYLVRHQLERALDILYETEKKNVDFQCDELKRIVEKASKEIAFTNGYKYLKVYETDGIEAVQGIIGLKLL